MVHFAGAGGALVRLLQRRDAALLLDAESLEGTKTFQSLRRSESFDGG